MHVEALTRDRATAQVSRLVELLASIPGVGTSREQVLAEVRGGVPLVGKWTHSLVACHGAQVVGVLLTHERPADTDVYGFGVRTAHLRPSFYLAGLAVAADRRGQGNASWLISTWLERTASTGMVTEPGPPAWSVQTNAALFNAATRRLYRRHGFQAVAMKSYANRTDVVMWRTSDTPARCANVR